jgi:hypothetical protein
LLLERLPDFIWLFERDELDSRFTRGGVLREILLSFVERLRLIAEGRSCLLFERLLLFNLS